MKSKKLIVMGLVMSLGLLFLGNEYYVSGSEGTNESKIDVLFESNTFDDAQKHYGVQSMGVSKSDEILSVGVDNMNNKEEVQKYFEGKMFEFGIENYEIEILGNRKM